MDNYKKLFEPYVDFSMDASCLRDIVYKGLKKAIVEGRIQTGSRIVEKRFADQMNISRTPVREALKRLEQEGLIEHVPNVGAVVRCVEVKDINSLYQAKLALEAILLPEIMEASKESDLIELMGYLKLMDNGIHQKSIGEIDLGYSKFENKLTELSGNKMILNLLNNLDSNYDRFRQQLSLCPKDYAQILEDSLAMVKAMEGKKLIALLEANERRQMGICNCLIQCMNSEFTYVKEVS